MIDLSYLSEETWETEYLSSISNFIPEIDVIPIHWTSETLYRRWFSRLRSKYILHKLVIPKAVSQKTVLIILSDELYRVPKKIPALAVFKQYVSDKDLTSIPFPLGVRKGFPSLLPKPIEKRTIDVGFVGRIYPQRKRFLAELSDHPKLTRFRLKLTCDIRLSISEYSEFLNNTKVSICLGGNSSPETFRYYESTKMGCIVISPQMPANALYRDHPGIQVGEINDVNHVAAVLQSVLEASEAQQAFQQRSLQTWESQYSPRAVAALIAHTVGSRPTGNRS